MAGFNLNPNNYKKGEADEVLLATAKQVIDIMAKRRPNKYLAKTQAERDRDLRKAEEIVANFQKKKREYEAKQAKKKK